MTENIRRLFKLMDHNTKKEALLCLKQEYGLQSRKLVKKEWIKGGRIPEAYQERTVAMFQNLLKKQQAMKKYRDVFQHDQNPQKTTNDRR